ncbi:ATP-NAD kinase [Fomitiporia mediterranea MF3/22]|uniref:ATP-NAD kinase n=1 Tax=Fomitiporia mediterranea (strain MF3/22) TaxID=694068 RepID=UPI0004408C98|nr:ATP-NAD kinase [Fomitiporia mediterranea MF3/22]EJD03164.1 ATP-NAD kinase [Fomitiporia mediterranea MF3/22]
MMGVPSSLAPHAEKPALYPNHSQPNLEMNQNKHPHLHRPFVQAMHPAMPLPQPPHSPGSSPDSDFDDEEEGASLTRQLAETAVGVREMSKQLGRARIRSNIQNVLIITKARDNRLIKLTREIALYLMQKPRNDGRGLVVYVDNQLRYSKRFDAAGIEREHPELFVPFPRRRSSSSHALAAMANGDGNGNGNGSGSEASMNQGGQLRYWTSDICSRSPHLFDFVVTLGGDGTVLFTSWLFQRIVPPVLPFALGSLGFLTNFDFADHRAVMDSAIDNGIRVNLRMRFTCTVYRAVAPEPGKGRRAVKKADTGEIMMRNLEKGGWEALEGGWSEAASSKEGKKCGKDKEIMCFTTRPVESFEVLNDLVVDRGPSPYMSLLELFGDEHHMTTVQADGLTVSTPTGSTAYSLSAGGSLVHPEIPALLITPICPHTLSFRPMLLPDSMELRICVPFNSRSTAWASFDGRGRVELKQGDHIKVTASKYPFPTVCADKQSTDWFQAIQRTLKWNERERQKSFVVVEEGPAKPKSQKHKRYNEQITAAVAKPVISDVPEEDRNAEDDEEDEVSDDGEEEEEKFDIDDSSAPEASKSESSTDLVAMAKAREEERAKEEAAQARAAALALTGHEEGSDTIGSTWLRERSDTIRSGIQTPDRFAGAHPHPPRVSPRHVSFGDEITESASSGTSGEKGDRDHIHSPQLLSSGRSRIPRDRDLEAESAKTPTMSNWELRARDDDQPHRVHRSRSREPSSVGRAFAVWGQDESDSNTSDSDV